MLLDAMQKRVEFPELKKIAKRKYDVYTPDSLIVEAKASGWPLIYELRAMGIPVAEYTPSRGNDKGVRVNSIADMFSEGIVWRPETRWAEEVMEQFASFPSGENDDLVDASTLALMRFRRGGFVPLPTDGNIEDDENYVPINAAYY